MARDGNTRSPLGLVLAGGRSRRMGFDKTRYLLPAASPLLPQGAAGRSLVEWAAARLHGIVSEVAVANGSGLLSGLPPGVHAVADGAGRGPLAGLLGAFTRWPERALLVLACDLPLVPRALLERLLALAPSAPWVVPRGPRGLEPLCALYAPPALRALAEEADRGRHALYRLADTSLPRRELTASELIACGDPERLFLNLNHPADLARLSFGAAGETAARGE